MPFEYVLEHYSGSIVQKYTPKLLCGEIKKIFFLNIFNDKTLGGRETSKIIFIQNRSV